jgi:hypothetical protein
MSLERAVTCEWLDEETKQVAQHTLDSWNKLPLEAPEIQDWILQILGYFKGCYYFGSESDGLTVNEKQDPMQAIDSHAGVHLIRQYYPDFQPTSEHFTNAYWGQKPS